MVHGSIGALIGRMG